MKPLLFTPVHICAALVFLALRAPAMAEDSSRHADSFDSAGVKIAYVTAGDGEPVILIHGLYSSAAMNWEMPGTFEMLAKHYHVIALDLRGHGQSDKPTDEASYGQPMADDILRLMDHLKIPKAQVVGYSLGGIIVMKFVIDHPDRVVAATLGGMGWLRKGSVFQEAFTRMGGAGQTPAACAHGIAKLAVTEEQIKSVKVPINMLVGDHDPCKRMYVDPLEKIRPDWPVTVIDNAGHISCIAKPQFKAELLKSIEKHFK
jgi:pimeloyl-ACP methyl ester carboxylesterase